MSLAAILVKWSAGSYQTSAITKSSVITYKWDIKRGACETHREREVFHPSITLNSCFVKKTGWFICDVTALLILMLDAFFLYQKATFAIMSSISRGSESQMLRKYKSWSFINLDIFMRKTAHEYTLHLFVWQFNFEVCYVICKFKLYRTTPGLSWIERYMNSEPWLKTAARCIIWRKQ